MKNSLLASTALLLLATTLPAGSALPAHVLSAAVCLPCQDPDHAAIAGDDGDDEFGENDLYDENGTLTDNPDRPDRGDIGEQGEYREGEFGERDDSGWNRPPYDNEGESGELLEGLGQGGVRTMPSDPLVDGVGQGGSSGGLLN